MAMTHNMQPDNVKYDKVRSMNKTRQWQHDKLPATQLTWCLRLSESSTACAVLHILW